MRKISFENIVSRVAEACMAANFEIGEDVVAAFIQAREKEESPVGQEILGQLLANAAIAQKEKIALCQDTGFAVFFVDMGDEVKVDGGNLVDAIRAARHRRYPPLRLHLPGLRRSPLYPAP